ncbi:L domain-like protein [Gonapodya prolifera JEL478]|uniref:L domain-like protein n=1 Tax=Gonapodya prolifera (strain JEL478) TaxID=1344416 RepID=A0A138ZYM1_GONPJ|nr:L domain-like protein [Gonapodya prolifera JEL478]|eukprot:KXS09599.1 L domain-like protein [Gonapodya prolifera JEL478]
MPPRVTPLSTSQSIRSAPGRVPVSQPSSALPPAARIPAQSRFAQFRKQNADRTPDAKNDALDRAAAGSAKALDRRILAMHVEGRINVSNKGLERIPQVVFDPKSTLDDLAAANEPNLPQWWDFQDVTRLVAADNRIAELDDKIGALGALTVLDLRNNAIPSLPASISTLPLTHLTLSNNNLTAFPDFACLPTLHTLALSRNRVRALPPELARCTALMRLEVAENELVDLGGLGACSSVEVIVASANHLTTLPPALFLLLHLTELDVSSNRLATLGFLSTATASADPTPLSLPRLRRLDVRKNQMLRFADASVVAEGAAVGNARMAPVSWALPALEELLAGYNRLEDVDALVGAAPKLATLELSTNRLSSVPSSVLPLALLHRLDLSNNAITTLPPQLGLLPLDTLVIEGNPVRNLPQGAGKSTRILLQGLRDRIKGGPAGGLAGADVGAQGAGAGDILGGGKAGSVLVPTQADAAARVVNLSKRGLSDGDLANMRDALSVPALAFEPVSCDASDNKLARVPDLVYDWAHLTVLSLAGNKLERWDAIVGDATGPAPLTYLRELDLSRNALAMFPDVPGGSSWRPLFPALDTLILSYNRIGRIPETVNQMFPKLTVLLAESNRIVEMGRPDVSLANLEVLDVRNNEIAKVPEELGLCRKIRAVKMEGNPFRVPRQAVMQQGTDAILKWLRDRLPTPVS